MNFYIIRKRVFKLSLEMNTTNGIEDFLSKTDMFEISGEMSSSDQLSQLNVNDDDDDDYNAEAVNVGGGGGGALDFDFSSLELDVSNVFYLSYRFCLTK